MKNFDWTSFTKTIAVKADLSTVYNAWTHSAELEKWFLKKALFFNEAGAPIGKNTTVSGNNTYKWYWYLYEELMEGLITQVNGTDFIQFTFEGGCLVDVRLEVRGEYTIVTLIQHNIPTDDHTKQFVRLGCTNGWTFYLTNLKSVYEGGLDLRNKEEGLSPMLNN